MIYERGLVMGSSYTSAGGSIGGFGFLFILLALIIVVILVVAVKSKKAAHVHKNITESASESADTASSAVETAKVESLVCTGCGAVVKVKRGESAECEYCGAVVSK
jgi:uncharacterized membrane protein